MDYEEAAEAAVDKRKFLLNNLLRSLRSLMKKKKKKRKKKTATKRTTRHRDEAPLT